MSKKQIRQNFEQIIKPPKVSDIFISLKVTAVAILIYGSFIAVLLPLTNNNLYGLYGFSKEMTHAQSAHIPWQKYAHPKPGYDGQFYFRLALDPFTDQKKAFGINLDAPLMRQQRILLPFFTWLIARGTPEATPPVMMAINLGAVAGCAFVAGLLLMGLGISGWYALLFALYPGFAVSVGRFLTEPLALFMILSSLLMLAHRKNLMAAILLSFAVLARETATLVVAAGFFTWLSGKIFQSSNQKTFSPHFSFWLYPTLTFFLWQFWLWNNWTTVLLDGENISKMGVPLAGFIRAVALNITNLNPETGFYLIMLFAFVVYQIFICRWIRHFPLILVFSWACYVLLISCTKTAVWSNSTSFLRLSAELNMLGLLAFLIVGKRTGSLFVSFWVSAWIMAAGAEWYHLYSIR